MRKSVRWVLVMAVLLGLSSLSCQLFSDDEAAEVEPTAVPAEVESEDGDVAGEPVQDEPADSQSVAGGAAEPATSEESASESAIEAEEEIDGDDGFASDVAELPELLDLSTVEREFDFSSYRFIMSMNFEGIDDEGNEVAQNIEAEVAFVSELQAMSVAMQMDGIEGAEESGELMMAQIAGTSYMVMPGLGCITTSTDDNNLLESGLFTELLDPNSLLQDLKGARKIGDEVINGIPTIVYEFDQSFLDTDDEVEWAEGRIHVAKDGNYVVRLEMDGEGALDLLQDESSQTGSLHVEFDLSEVNEPIEIGVPAECTGEGDTGSEWPMLEDAYEVSSFSGFLSYRSDVELDEAIGFYADALSNEGWAEDESQSVTMSGTAILTYVKAGESLNLTISEDSESGGLFIILAGE